MPPDGAGDRQLAKRLTREARAAATAAARAQLAYERAVRRRSTALETARRRLPRAAGLAAGATVVNVGLFGADGTPVLWLLAGGAALRAAAAAARLRRPPPVPPRPALPGPPVAPPPDRRSAAWPAVRRLEAVRGQLTALLPLVAPAGRAAADEAWQAAAEADAALRWQAARLSAVEPHRGADPELLSTLHAGVQCQERLVAAVADLVAASADPLATDRLQDATDALHGLAQGLREVR